MTKDESTKQGLNSLVFYRLYSLIANGVQDPEKIIMQEIQESIRGAGAQIEFLNMDENSGHRVSESLNDCIKILSSMQEQERLDNESMDIVIGILESLKECSDKFSDTLKGDSNE